jgi:Xaa-Pro dipeptidase
VHNYSDRLSRLQELLAKHGIDGMLISQNVDLYYFTGSMQTGFLFVPQAGCSVFYVRRSVVRAQQESCVSVEPLGSLRAFGAQLAQSFPELFSRTGSADAPLIAAEYDVLPVQWHQRLQGALPGVRWTDGSMLVREVRMIKAPSELALIRQAAEVIDRALTHALLHLREGMKEFEWMALIEHQIRMEGHLGIMRMRGYNQEIVTGAVGAGEAIATPTYFDGPAGGLGLSAASPQSSSRRPMGRDEPILIDIGCCIEGYVIDQTRTAVIGAMPEDLAFAYSVSESILRRTEELLKPGTVCEDVYVQSLAQADAAGLGAHFMGYGSDQVKFLGHGIGLEIDELPVLARGFRYSLEPGMVIAVEPKFTFPGRGVVGIENSYVITESGCEKLTVSREGILTV